MWGSATLAIVVSSTCSSTAAMTPTVTIRRTPVGSGCEATLGSSDTDGLFLLVEVDRRVDRQARDHRLRRVAFEGNAHRHALRHLDPVAVGVLRWQQRELAASAGADALDIGVKLLAGIGVDFHRRALARDHAADVLLLEVGFDPRRVAVNNRQHADAGYGHLPNLQIVGILDATIHH